jgi:hypothetical protein
MPWEELLFTVNPEKFTNISAQDFLKASYNISPRNIDKRNVRISEFFKPTRHRKRSKKLMKQIQQFMRKDSNTHKKSRSHSSFGLFKL